MNQGATAIIAQTKGITFLSMNLFSDFGIVCAKKEPSPANVPALPANINKRITKPTANKAIYNHIPSFFISLLLYIYIITILNKKIKGRTLNALP